VAAGLAETFGIDVLLVRVLWVLAALAGFGIPLYIVAWIAIPAGDGGTAGGQERTREISLALGLGLIALGVFIAFDRAWPGRPHFGRITWPVFLIVGGVALLLFRRTRDDERETERGTAADTTRHDTASVAVTTASDSPAPPITGPDPAARAVASQPPPASAWGQTAPWPQPPGASPPWPPGPPAAPRPRRPREQPFLTPLTLSVLLIGTGVVALLHALDVIDVDEPSIVFAAALGIVAVVLILAAWVGRARMLILVGIPLAFVAIATAVLDVPLRGGWGDRTYVPGTRAELRPKYELSGGELHLDLRRVPLRNSTTRIEATVGLGELRVDVPTDVRVVAHARASAGGVDLFGHTEEGLHVDTRETARGTAAGVLRLELRVGAGEIIVQRFDRAGEVRTAPVRDVTVDATP
jgi:hypothetical protein